MKTANRSEPYDLYGERGNVRFEYEYRGYFIFLFCCFFDDFNKSSWIKCGGTDEETIYFAFTYEFVSSDFRYASSVDNPTLCLSKDFSDKHMDFFGIFWSCRLPCSDCPNWFVSNVDSGRILDSCESFLELDMENILRKPFFSLS